MKTYPLLLSLMLISAPLFAADAPATAPAAAPAAPVLLLWPDGAPGSEGKTAPEGVATSRTGERTVTSVHKPDLTVYLPEKDKATGVGVLVMPGGGHRQLAFDHEGHYVAKWLADHGIAAFVLKYRLAREAGSTYTVEKDELADTQRAMRLIRSHAAEWGVDPARLGVMGFSAGGELAALVTMQNDAGKADAADPIERQGCKPAFQALIYPGNTAAIKAEAGMPPTFLLCGANDRPDISEGLANVYLLYKRANVPVELHIYTGVGHGFGLRPTSQGPTATWPDRFNDWLRDRGFFKKT